MKISKERREEIRRSLVHAAVELFCSQGVDETSLREVAKRAGVAPATIYKYFPNKERLFYAYFEYEQQNARADYESIEGLEDFSFKERLQAYLECLLARYAGEREFVALALAGLMDSPLRSLGAMQAMKNQVTEVAQEIFIEAVERDEIPPGNYDDFLASLFWDYSLVVVLHWLKDESEGYTKTSEFIDLSLELYVEVVRTSLVDKGARLLGFLLKGHLFGNLDRLTSMVAGLGAAVR